jgi:NADP-reducing hydrogenase subunit HndB
MSKLKTREDLVRLREELKSKEEKIQKEGKITRILVGMATCGIAAGAEETMKAFQEHIEKMGLVNVEVKPTGCIGKCSVEPTVEVQVPGMPTVIYGRVTPDTARKILEKHVAQKILLNEAIQDKPAIDIIKEGV